MALPFWRSAAVALALVFAAEPARASGGYREIDWSLSEYGGSAADRRILYARNPGVLMATSPASILFTGWRWLHGRGVSTEAGEALAVPCCGARQGALDAMSEWLNARTVVAGAPPKQFITTERRGPNYTSRPNCLDDAFHNAARTLKDRVQAHGAQSAETRFWLDAQDTVFRACSEPVDALPPLPADAPGWLQADYHYQSAALAFYNADYAGAADAFGEIAADATSPWQGIAPYLRVRTLLRASLEAGGPAHFAMAQEAAAAIPADAPMGRAAAQLGRMAQLHTDPAAASARLLAALEADTLTVQAASDFKDLQSLGAANEVPDILDWISTYKVGAARSPVGTYEPGNGTDRAKAAEERRGVALAHARERYEAGHDPAWLLAVLALAQPGELTGTSILADAASIDSKAPAYLTALYHRIRLTLATADLAGTRTLLDAALARADLTASTRNLFLAERSFAVANGAEFARFLLRSRVCAEEAYDCKYRDWGNDLQTSGLFDRNGDVAKAGLGDDAAYVIDRMALAPRMALGTQASLPTPIRLDLALTNFVRAVLLRNDAAVDALCGQLQVLLPVMAEDFGAVLAAPQGPDRAFAEYFIFAKIPGLRADLVDYTRPVGKPGNFEGRWPDWTLLSVSDADNVPPDPIVYDTAAYQAVDVATGTDLGGGHIRIPDVVCKGMCGAGGFVPQLPRFLSGTSARAAAERRLLPSPANPTDRSGTIILFYRPVDPDKPTPRGSTFMWEAILDYATRHPNHPRVPEVLYWLIHVGHYGQGHNHSGKRAFMLLKSQYPASQWAKNSLYYYD